MSTSWWTIGQIAFLPGGEQIVRVGAEMLMRDTPAERFRPLNVTYAEHTPTAEKPIGILHFEDADTGRVGTLVAQAGQATVCYNHGRAVTHPAATISEKTRALLPATQRA